MQDLRLVGVHEDGEHLLLSGGSGATYRLAIDEALRAAARPAPRVQAAGTEAETALPPREIQARIRAGATVEEVAAESGEELERILRFEGPVRAERDYMASLARQVEVSSALPAADGGRPAFDDDPATLGDMVNHRLRDFGIDPATLAWDAWRLPDGEWEVVAAFTLPADGTPTVGEEPPARWIYSPTRKTIRNANRWAQQLSELEPVDGAVPARRLTAVADRVFDFEAEGADEPPAGPEQDTEDREAADNLLEVLRSRRGHRLGVDEEADDALALMLNRGHIPAAHPRGVPSDAHPSTGELPAPGSRSGHDDAARPPFFPPLSLAPVHGTPAGPLQLHGGVSTMTREITLSGEPHTAPVPAAEDDPAPAGEDNGPGQPEDQDAPSDPAPAEEVPPSAEPAEPAQRDEPPVKRSVKPKRSSIPSWDEIVFGTKSE
ncbi:septation protein SepH [Arthrobacter sp. GCM10027362]|uniref:septation protein SepH n=1 Tax=Arthrobacter sp. GCM10027362 TaxID=3273379 RepID=UPI0036346DEF